MGMEFLISVATNSGSKAPALLSALWSSVDAGSSEEGICAVPAVLIRLRVR